MRIVIGSLIVNLGKEIAVVREHHEIGFVVEGLYSAAQGQRWVACKDKTIPLADTLPKEAVFSYGSSLEDAQKGRMFSRLVNASKRASKSSGVVIARYWQGDQIICKVVEDHTSHLTEAYEEADNFVSEYREKQRVG